LRGRKKVVYGNSKETREKKKDCKSPGGGNDRKRG